MRINSKLFFLFVIISCGSTPIKTHKTIQWLPESGNCHLRKKDGEIIRKCFYPDGTPEERNWIMVKKSDFAAELNWQSTLINKCKKWKK